MHDQLHHLLALSEQDNITVQVIPFDLGAYATSSGPATILRFSDEESPDAVYLEYPSGGDWVENGDDVQAFVASFADVSAAALSPDASATAIRARAGELRPR